MYVLIVAAYLIHFIGDTLRDWKIKERRFSNILMIISAIAFLLSLIIQQF